MVYKKNIIVGGGIAGLFLHYVFTINNMESVLITKNVGGEQTNLSQGIIHGGLKYALNGFLTNDSESIRDMPALWKSYLASPFFSDVKLLSQTMALIPNGNIGAKLNSFFASTLTSSRSGRESSGLYPVKNYYVLKEDVFDPISLVKSLMKLPNIIMAEVNYINDDSTISLSDNSKLKFGNLLVMAGKGTLDFEKQFDLKLQRRPLRMLQIVGDTPNLFCHVIGNSKKPLATITANNRGLYIGGEIAEKGVTMEKSSFLDWSMEKLSSYGFQLENNANKYEIIDVDRIEAQCPDNSKPNGPTIMQRENIFFGLPTKLTFAPSLARDMFEKVT